MAEQATLQDNEEEEDSPTIGEHDNERDEQSQDQAQLSRKGNTQTVLFKSERNLKT